MTKLFDANLCNRSAGATWKSIRAGVI